MLTLKKTLATLLAVSFGAALLMDDGIAQAQKKKGAAELVPENLARGKQASASSFQDAARGADKGIDGDLDSR